MVNNEWFWEEPGDYRERVMNISSNMILAEIATSLHEVARQLAELNSYRRRTETELERFGG